MAREEAPASTDRNPPPSRAHVWWRRATTVGLAGYWLLMFAGTHVPKIPKALEPRFSDKWQHYVAYAGLGALLGLWWVLRRPLTWKTGLALWLGILCYGALDEITQPLVGRDAELLDWRADAIGAATGLALLAIGLWLVRKRRHRKCAG